MRKRNLIFLVPFLFFANGLNAVSSGTFEGFGYKARGMGGVGIALPQDSLVGAMNPAGMVHLGNRYDIGLSSPFIRVKYKVKGNADPANDGTFSSKPDIYLPEAGFNKMLNNNLSIGFSMWGRGSGEYYGKRVGGNLSGTSNTGSELVFMYSTPSVSYKINEVHSLGIGIDLSLARTKNKGFQSLALNSIHPNHVTNKSFNWTPGVGFHLGWMGKITDCLSLGASYHSPTWHQKFHKYTGLLPDEAKVVVPASFGFGIAFAANPQTILGLDLVTYLNSDSRTFGNRLTVEHPNGSKKGTGVGWKNQSSIRLGATHQYSEALTLRIGYIYNTEMISSSQLLNNIVDGFFSRNVFTIGATWTNACHDFDIFYHRGFKNVIKSGTNIPAQLGGGGIKASLVYDWVGVMYGQRF